MCAATTATACRCYLLLLLPPQLLILPAATACHYWRYKSSKLAGSYRYCHYYKSSELAGSWLEDRSLSEKRLSWYRDSIATSLLMYSSSYSQGGGRAVAGRQAGIGKGRVGSGGWRERGLQNRVM